MAITLRRSIAGVAGWTNWKRQLNHVKCNVVGSSFWRALAGFA
ncbi:hypothetical protein [Paenibacillus sp. HW567]|nr:hypothetical protein [Paenibacillus sp. HW567]